MFKVHRILALPLLVLVFAISACDSSDTPPEPTPTTGVITGTVSLRAGISGSINNARVAIYSGYDDWLNDRVLRNVSADGGGNYSFNEVTPGPYYADVWLDRNNNATIDTGDFYGVYGSNAYPNFQPTPFTVSAGQTMIINFEAIVIP